MKNQIILAPNMGGEIITHLSQFGQLPERGIVAGQAVASAIQDLYGPGGGVYNDVDIFRLVGTQVLHRANTAIETANLTHLARAGEEDQYTYLEQYLEEMRTYRVSTVTRDDMLNYVNCTMPLSLGRHLTAGRVIESFDLNCVRVGVDLSTKRLVWDRHFEKFVNSRQLEIVAVHTPWHTFFRLLKKLEELPGVYADLEASAEVACAISQSSFYQRFVQSGTISRAFGLRARETAERFHSGWAPYFSLQENTRAEHEATLYSLQPRADVQPWLLEQVDALHCSALHYTAQLVYGSRLKKSVKIQVRRQEFEAVLEQERDHKNNVFVDYLTVQGCGYLEGQTSARHLSTVRKFLSDHFSLRDKFTDMTLDQQYQLIRRLQKIEPEFGPWIYGALENEATATDLRSEEEVRDLLKRYLEAAVVPFTITPLVLPKLPAAWKKRGVVVEELLRPVDLLEEGEQLGHCVGGYAGKVRSNYSRILRIRTSAKRDDWSTAEIQSKNPGRVTGKSTLETKQHRGRFNSNASSFNEQVLQYVLYVHGKPAWQAKLLAIVGIERAAYAQAWALQQALGAFSALSKLCGIATSTFRSLDKWANTMVEDAQHRIYNLEAEFGVKVKRKAPKKPSASKDAVPAFNAPGFADCDDEVPF